jgi:hypothetical protein
MSNECIQAAKAELARVGIHNVEIAHGGKHPQLRFVINGGPVHIFSVPGTPGDFRSPANTRTSLRRYLAGVGVDLGLSSELKTPERAPSRLELLERRVTELERRFAEMEGSRSESPDALETPILGLAGA